MSQKKNTELLLQLYNAISGKNATLEEAVKICPIDPNISFNRNRASVNVEEYYTLEYKLCDGFEHDWYV